MSDKMAFNKPPLSIEQQIDLLISRGMTIPSRDYAIQKLLTVNYYRFSGYALHFEEFKDRERTHKFKPHTSFNTVIKLHDFDAKLRRLLFESLEKVEIAFRTRLCFFMVMKYNDSHWYIDKTIYKERFNYTKLIKDSLSEVDRSDEIFIKSYKQKYDDPALPATWMMTEVLSLGKWSLIYSNLKERQDRKMISDSFDVSPDELESWIHALSVLRNICAHHGRLWNRNFKFKVKLKPQYKSVSFYNSKLAAFCFIIKKLLSASDPEYPFIQSLSRLFDEYPFIPIHLMGFDNKWKENILWWS